jgi:hypothetical protein
MDETWRWRLKVGERDQDRFWLQLVRYASDAPYAARAPGLRLDASVVSAQPGEAIQIRARVQDARHNPSPQPTQTLEVRRNDSVIKTVMLTNVGNSGSNISGRYEGTLRDLPAGDYQLRLAAPANVAPTGGPPSDARLDLHIAPSYEEEMADLSGSAQPLSDLAKTTGGAELTLAQLRTLPDRINRSQVVQGRLVERPIWDSGYLYAFVVACFAAEWAIRKRVGLV